MSRRTGNHSTYPYIIALALVIGASIGVYAYTRQTPAAQVQTTPETEAQQVIAKVSQHAKLPEDEEPALYTIVDKTQQQQAFFASSENGDKVLVYTQARKAILYRPSIDKIIEMGPLVVATPQP